MTSLWLYSWQYFCVAVKDVDLLWLSRYSWLTEWGCQRMVKKRLLKFQPVLLKNTYSSYLLSEVSSLSSDSVSCCLSDWSSVYLRMLLSRRGTLVQCCIGDMSRSVSCSLWHLTSCSHHCKHTAHNSLDLLNKTNFIIHKFSTLLHDNDILH